MAIVASRKPNGVYNRPRTGGDRHLRLSLRRHQAGQTKIKSAKVAAKSGVPTNGASLYRRPWPECGDAIGQQGSGYAKHDKCGQDDSKGEPIPNGNVSGVGYKPGTKYNYQGGLSVSSTLTV